MTLSELNLIYGPFSVLTFHGLYHCYIFARYTYRAASSARLRETQLEVGKHLMYFWMSLTASNTEYGLQQRHSLNTYLIKISYLIVTVIFLQEGTK